MCTTATAKAPVSAHRPRDDIPRSSPGPEFRTDIAQLVRQQFAAVRSAREALRRGDRLSAELSAIEARGYLLLAESFQRPLPGSVVSQVTEGNGTVQREVFHEVGCQSECCHHDHDGQHHSNGTRRSMARVAVAIIIGFFALFALASALKLPSLAGWTSAEHEHTKVRSTADGALRDETRFDETPPLTAVSVLGSTTTPQNRGTGYVGLSSPGTIPGMTALTANAANPTIANSTTNATVAATTAPETPHQAQSAIEQPIPETVLTQPDPDLRSVVAELSDFFADGPKAFEHLREVRREFRNRLGRSESRFTVYLPEQYRSVPVDKVPLPVLQEAHTRYVANEARVALALGNDRAARTMSLDEYISVLRAISGTGIAAADLATGTASVVMTARGQFDDVYKYRFGAHDEGHHEGGDLSVPFTIPPVDHEAHGSSGAALNAGTPMISSDRPLYRWLNRQRSPSETPAATHSHDK